MQASRKRSILLVLLPVLAVGFWWLAPLPGDSRVDVGFAGEVYGAPPARVWAATMSGRVCTDGAPATLIDVALQTRGDVRRTDAYVFTITPAQRREAGVGGFGGARGAPPDFDEPYASRGARLPGKYEKAVGATVTAPCDIAADSPPVPWQSLLISQTVGPEGGQIVGVELTFRSLGRDRTVRFSTELAACGIEQRTRGCPRMRVDRSGRTG